jgi:hypothetical protein
MSAGVAAIVRNGHRHGGSDFDGRPDEPLIKHGVPIDLREGLMAKVKWVASNDPEIPNRGKFVIVQPGREGGHIQYEQGRGLTYDPKSNTPIDDQIGGLLIVAQGHAEELGVETIYVIRD